MNIRAILTIFLFAGSLLLISTLDADAARFGGGRSFGGKPSMQRSTTAPIQQKAPMANAAPTAQKSGMMGGMGGMLGGLLAGTLLGSLLFGGAFNGAGFMDILLIAILAYFGFKLFARMRAGREATATGPGGGGRPAGMHYQAQSNPAQQNDAWGALRSNPQYASSNVSVAVPAGFDTEDFLRGAKMAYTRLQSAWDKRDINDIAQFATEAVLQEVRTQFAENPTPSKTELLMVNAQLLGVQEERGEQTASVFFDVLMRENLNQETAQIREVWHFTRPSDGQGSWKLDGIQQVD